MLIQPTQKAARLISGVSDPIKDIFLDVNKMNEQFKQYLKETYKNRDNLYKELTSTRQDPYTLCASLRDLQHLGDCSRRLPIIADTNLLIEDFNEAQGHHPECYSIDDGVYHVQSAYAGAAFKRDTYDVRFLTNNLQSLETWFHSSKAMIDSGRILYLPTFEKLDLKDEWFLSYTGEDPGEFHMPSPRNEEVVSRIRLPNPGLFPTTMESDFNIGDPNLIPLLQLDIPALESLSLSQLTRIMDDYPDKLLSFRNHLQKQLLNLQNSLDSGRSGAELRMITADLKDRLFKLTDDLKQLQKVTAIEVLGAQLITWSLFVFVFMSSPNELLKILLPGGAVASATTSLTKYLKEHWRLKRDPVYFLFLVSKRAKVPM